jgi:hypothetical protein
MGFFIPVSCKIKIQTRFTPYNKPLKKNCKEKIAKEITPAWYIDSDVSVGGFHFISHLLRQDYPFQFPVAAISLVGLLLNSNTETRPSGKSGFLFFTSKWGQYHRCH